MDEVIDDLISLESGYKDEGLGRMEQSILLQNNVRNTTLWNTTLWNITLWNTTLWNITLWNTTLWNTTLWNITLWNTTLWNTTLWNIIHHVHQVQLSINIEEISHNITE